MKKYKSVYPAVQSDTENYNFMNQGGSSKDHHQMHRLAPQGARAD